MIDIQQELSYAEQAAAIIRKRSNNFKPHMAVVLGSGLGKVAELVENPVVIPFADLPYFSVSEIKGHKQQLSLGMLHGVPVICLQGRSHSYQGSEALIVIRNVIRTLKLLGCEVMLTTNSVGSLREDFAVGDLVSITDQMNFTNINPLTGIGETKFGPLFVSMDDAYNSELRTLMHEVAQKEDITLHDGVYIATSGPSFETPAEIRAYKLWGADIVGMSTAPETIMARKVGIKVVTVAVVTNPAAGLSVAPLSHKQTLAGAAIGTAKLIDLIIAFTKRYHYE